MYSVLLREKVVVEVVTGFREDIAVRVVGEAPGNRSVREGDGKAVRTVILFIDHAVRCVKLTVHNRVTGIAAYGVAEFIVIFLAVYIVAVVIGKGYSAPGVTAVSIVAFRVKMRFGSDVAVLIALCFAIAIAVRSDDAVTRVVQPGFHTGSVFHIDHLLRVRRGDRCRCGSRCRGRRRRGR